MGEGERILENRLVEDRRGRRRLTSADRDTRGEARPHQGRSRLRPGGAKLPRDVADSEGLRRGVSLSFSEELRVLRPRTES